MMKQRLPLPGPQQESISAAREVRSTPAAHTLTLVVQINLAVTNEQPL